MAGLLHSISSGSFFLYSAVHFCLIFQCSMFPKSTHETFAHKLYQTFKTHKRFIKPKLSLTDFTISHYAGEVNISCFFILAVLSIKKGLGHFLKFLKAFPILKVTYQADQFLDKNKDYVVAEHQALLTASKCSFVVGLFPPLPEESSKSSKFASIGSRFKVITCISFSSSLGWMGLRYDGCEGMMCKLISCRPVNQTTCCMFNCHM